MSFVVHVHEPVTPGAFVGRVTDVSSGVMFVFRNADELVAFLLDAGKERHRHTTDTTTHQGKGAGDAHI